MIKSFKNEAGYSLVEVMASIIILSIAIIPMVSMFDTGLRVASNNGNYDEARALANQQLEAAKNLPYKTMKTTFPSGTPAPGSSGTITSGSQPAGGLPNGSYTVTKAYVSLRLVDDADNSDRGLIKVSVRVRWGSNNSYSTQGIVVQ